MSSHGNLQLKDPNIIPTTSMLEGILGNSFPAYEAFQNTLPAFEIEQNWQWYTPYKVWFAKGQHFWTTPRGTIKEKTLYWLHIFEGYFDVTVWFKEKNRNEILNATIDDKTSQLINNAKTLGKMPTFPVVFDITSPEHLKDVYVLLENKKKLEK